MKEICLYTPYDCEDIFLNEKAKEKLIKLLDKRKRVTLRELVNELCLEEEFRRYSEKSMDECGWTIKRGKIVEF